MEMQDLKALVASQHNEILELKSTVAQHAQATGSQSSVNEEVASGGTGIVKDEVFEAVAGGIAHTPAMAMEPAEVVESRTPAVGIAELRASYEQQFGMASHSGGSDDGEESSEQDGKYDKNDIVEFQPLHWDPAELSADCEVHNAVEQANGNYDIEQEHEEQADDGARGRVAFCGPASGAEAT